MTPNERSRAGLRYQNRKNRAQGAYFERLIDTACEWYRMKEIADIEKTPEPMQPTKDLGNGKFIAHYTKAAQADYKGFMMGGRAVNFEAKYTDTGRMDQDRVTPDQAERLARAWRYGAHAFVLCSFGAVGFYRVPWEVWRSMKEQYGHKYMTPDEAAPYEIRIGGPGVLLFLDGLEERHECDFKDSDCPHGDNIIWWLRQPASSGREVPHERPAGAPAEEAGAAGGRPGARGGPAGYV